MLVRVALQLYMGLKPPPRPAKAMAMLLQQVALRAPRAALEPRDGFRSSPVWKSNLQPDFNVSVCDGFDATCSDLRRELDESNRFVQKSAESTSI